MTRYLLASLSLLFILTSPSYAQSGNQSIQTEEELATALAAPAVSEQARAELLKIHPQLVNTALWQQLSDLAAAAYYDQPAERCLAIYEVTAQVAKQLNNPRLLGQTHYNLGRSYSGWNKITEAIKAYEKSRDEFAGAGLKRDLIYVLADLGAFYFIQQDYQRARDYSEQSLSLANSEKGGVQAGVWPDEFGRARALLTLGELDLHQGDHTAAIEKFQKSLALYQQLNRQGSDYDGYVAGVLSSIAKVWVESGDYDQALRNLQMALQIAGRSTDKATLANILNNIGLLYMEQEDYQQAEAHFAQSLQINIESHDQSETARGLLNLGVVAQRQAHYDQALTHFRLSLTAARAAGIRDVEIAAGEGIGVVLTAQGNFPEAATILNQSLTIAKDTANTPRQIELNWRLAQLARRTGDTQKCATLAESAETMARQSRLPKLSYLAATTLGEAYAEQNKFELAKTALIRAISELELLREQVAGTDLEAELFLENKLTSYQTLVEVLIKQNKPLEALIASERAKGRVLLDALRRSGEGPANTLTGTEKKQAQLLDRQLFELNEEIKANQNDPNALQLLYSRLDAKRLEYQSFLDANYVAHPNLKRRSDRTAELTSRNISQLVRDNQALFEYSIVSNHLYLFVITGIASSIEPVISVYSIAGTVDDLERKVNQFHDQLANRNPDFEKNAHDLYTQLIAPAARELAHAETIGFVPDGLLWNLPFQALLDTNDHYLLEEHAVFHAPSLSVLSEMTAQSKVNTERARSLIAFGNPLLTASEERNLDCPLPEAETEVATIARTFGKPTAKILIGAGASEKTFKTLAPNYSYLHLATHGVIDNRHPLYSFLLLTRTTGEPDNDGRLEIREIMNLKLNADLAVLSACETANGRIAPGEGVMGMSWSFFVAGTRSLVVSQWKVDSEGTAQLMSNFYEALRSKNSRGRKAIALQHAALLTMKNRRYHHPFYWAAYVLVGRGK